MTEQLRVGIVGTGVMGSGHARFITSSVPQARVAAITDVDQMRAGALADELGGHVAVFKSPEDFFCAGAVDAVIIATPDHLHPDHLRLAIARGIPTLCEKPIASTVTLAAVIAREIRDDERANNRRLIHFGFMRRFDPSYLKVRKLLASGNFGLPLFVRAVTRNVSSANITTEGIFTNIAVHDFDTFRWLLHSEWKSVESFYPRQSSLSPRDLSDPLIFTAQLENDILVVGDIIANNHYGYDVRTEFVCESGSIEIGIHGDVITRADHVSGVLRGGSMDENWIPRFSAAYIGELNAWTESVRSGIPHPDLATVDDAVAASNACAMGIAGIRSPGSIGLTLAGTRSD